jgi:hypothetical protein
MKGYLLHGKEAYKLPFEDLIIEGFGCPITLCCTDAVTLKNRLPLWVVYYLGPLLSDCTKSTQLVNVL